MAARRTNRAAEKRATQKKTGSTAKPVQKAAPAKKAARKPAATAAKTARKPARAKPPLVLSDVRARIDGIDREIQQLIAERARFAQQVGRAKGKLRAAVDYYRPEREVQVLRGVLDRNDGPLSDEEMVRLFREIMSACLAQQEPLKVGYLGPEGTFSQLAVNKHFGHSAHGLPLSSIEEVFQEVESGNADFGVVPVENSTQGTIQSTLDMFITSRLKICGEVELRVHQHLLSRTGHIEDIERIYSHPQSFAQTKAWLRQHLPHVEKIPVGSNAEAARRARNADDAAAIAGASTGSVYGLKVVAGPIEDHADNTTRFLVLGRELFPPSGHDRTSLLIFIRDRPGALYQVLSPFAEQGLSMNRIESRPAHSGRWQYAFFVDIAGHVQDEAMKQAIAQLDASVQEVKVLGSYPVAVL